MTRDEVKKVLVKVVTDKQGLKATELCCEILDDAYLSDEQRHSLMHQEEFLLPDLIAELVKEEELIEVEYVLPNIAYRAKSFLLPKNTQVRIEFATFNKRAL